MYLLCDIRFYITFAIGQLSKYNLDPKVDNIKVIKKIVHYLKDTMHLRLIYRVYIKDERRTKILIRFSLF